MGHLQSEFNMTMLGKTPPGACPECAKLHPPQMPHDRESLAYQYKFYDEHGRWPTWEDAMAHCPGMIRVIWTKALQERGIKVEEVLKWPLKNNTPAPTPTRQSSPA